MLGNFFMAEDVICGAKTSVYPQSLGNRTHWVDQPPLSDSLSACKESADLEKQSD